MKKDKRRYATYRQRKGILERDCYKCRYCGIPVTIDTCNIDHVHPWKFGGKTRGKNLVTACPDCNKFKLNKVGIKPMPLNEVDERKYERASDLGRIEYEEAIQFHEQMDREFRGIVS